MGTKLIEFQKILETEGLDAFIITNLINVYYFTKFFSRSAAYYIVYSDKIPSLFVPELEYEDAKNKVKNSEVIKIGRDDEVLKVLKQNLEDNQVKILGIEENSMTVRFFQDISKKFDFLKLENGSYFIDVLRMTKTTDEVEKLKNACQIADRGLVAAIEHIDEGKSEIEVATEAEYVMRKAGSESAPFDTIVASGYRSALPHGVSSHKKINRGDLIIIDLGAKTDGYCSDMTRTVVLGKPSAKQMDIYNSVLTAQKNSIEICEVGTPVKSIEEEARKFLSEDELDEYFVHSLGHGVGLDVHELPHLALKSKEILEENNVFTVEPGVYIPDFGGVRIEDVVLITKDGPKILTKSNYEIEI